MLMSHALGVTVAIGNPKLAPIMDGVLTPMAMVIPMHNHHIATAPSFSSRQSLLMSLNKVCR